MSVRLAYLPQPQRDELLYSLLARYGRHAGIASPGALVQTLFGTRGAVAEFDLPCRLEELVERLPVQAEMGVDDVIDELTLYPYYAAYRTLPERRALRAAMRTRTPSIYVAAGLAAFRVPRVTRLRFCPDCDREMVATCGERWWRRAFQLPGVLVCPDHGCRLRLGTVDLAVGSRHAFVAATAETCPPDSEMACPPISDAASGRLLEFAQAGAALLLPASTPWCRAAAVEARRGRLAAADLMRSAHKVDHARLARAVSAFWGDALAVMPGTVTKDGEPGAWLTEIVRSHRKGFHPLHHLLLEGVLRNLPAAAGPFGSGPWECRNPLSAHRGRRVVVDLEHRGRHDAGHGVFTCRCGYVYTRTFSADGTVGPARPKRFGPLLEPALRRLLVPGATPSGVAAALGLDCRTLLREVDALRIPVPWPPSDEGHAPAMLPRKEVVAAPRRPSAGARRDWPAIDASLGIEVRAAAAAILAEDVPKRVTLAEIERRLGARGRLRRRRSLLPVANRLAESLVEGVDAFRMRRIGAVAGRMFAEDADVQAWRVMRAAGVTRVHLPTIGRTLLSLKGGGGRRPA